MTISQILTTMNGVWEGTYTVMSPTGELIERFPSRQEGRMAGTDWTEKVVYFKGGEPVVQHFHAVVSGDDVVFGNDEIWGETVRAGDRMIVFTFGWTSRPGERIVETSMPDGDYRTRVWQHFENNELSKITLIEEHRDPSQIPEAWFNGA